MSFWNCDFVILKIEMEEWELWWVWIWIKLVNAIWVLKCILMLRLFWCKIFSNVKWKIFCTNWCNCTKNYTRSQFLTIIYVAITYLHLRRHNIDIYIDNFKTKFIYKISCRLRLQTYLISFYWMWIMTNPLLDYIFFLYPPCLQNFKKIKDQ